MRWRAEDCGATCRQPAVAGAALVLSVLLAAPLPAAVITVAGGCNLASAIRAANTNLPNGSCPAGSARDIIVLTGDVALLAVEEVDDGNNGLPTVISEIIIEGNGHTIERSASALSDFRILKVGSAGDLTLRNTTVSGGKATAASFPGNSGGAFSNSGALTLEWSALVSNRSTYYGGAVHNRGSLYAFDSTFAENVVRDPGGGSFGGAVTNDDGYFLAERSVFDTNFVGEVGAFVHTGYGGAIHQGLGTVEIIDSTLTGNNVLATNAADGWAINTTSLGVLELSNSTVSGNGSISTPSPGAAILHEASLTNVTLYGNRGYALDGDFTSTATLIAGTSDGPNCSSSTTVSGVNNIADDASCPDVPVGLMGLDPVLADNGGPTPTHALQAGSNAIDAAGFCAVAADQRGAPRVGACDAGAFEFMGCPVLTLSDDIVNGEETFEECAITAGPGFTVLGPAGDLTMLFGASVRLANGFSVETDGRLAVEQDPSLQLVLDELIEADRARRRALSWASGGESARD